MSGESLSSAPPGPRKSVRFLTRTLRGITSLLGQTLPIYVVLVLAIAILVPYVLPILIPWNRNGGAFTGDEGLGIEQLITGVKEELIKTEEARRLKADAPLFELKDFDLEISFVVRASSSHKGRASYQVLTVDSDVQTGSERVQRLRLHMTAVPQLSKSESKSPTSSPLPRPPNGVRVIVPTPPK
jgi:hypothetical protein